MVFRKSCKVFCAKPKEVDPIKLNFSMTNKCLSTIQICNEKQSIKMNWNRASIIGKPLFLIENISSRYIFYIFFLGGGGGNDTHSLCVCPKISSLLSLFVLWLFRLGLSVIHMCYCLSFQIINS